MTYQDIPGDTMFDFHDFYSKIGAEYSNARLCEVGVADGKSAVYLAEHTSGTNTIFLVDNLAYGGQDQFKTILTNVYNSGLQKNFDLRGLGLSSLDASCKFPDQYFDFVFLDSSHEYEMTKVEILLWWRKLKKGGVLAGHDSIGIQGVGNAVREMLPEAKIQTTSKGHGLWWIEKQNQKIC